MAEEQNAKRRKSNKFPFNRLKARLAIEDVLFNGLTYPQAVAKHDQASSTIQQYVQAIRRDGKKNERNMRRIFDCLELPGSGRVGFLDATEKQVFNEFLVQTRDLGKGHRPKDVIALAAEIAKAKNSKTKVTKDWARNVLHKNSPDISLAKAKKTCETRTSKHDMAHVRQMMNDLDGLVEPYRILPDSDPCKLKTKHPLSTQWYNMDEKHIEPDGGEESHVGSRKSKSVCRQASGDRSKFHVTVMLTTCGGGDTPDERFPIPPGLVHVGPEGGMRRINTSCGSHAGQERETLPDNYIVGQTTKGSVNKVIFMQWCKHFVKHLPKHQVYPVFALFDHHFSRDQSEAMRYLKLHNVIVIFGPSHMTILWQPNDNGANAAIDRCYNDLLREFSARYPVKQLFDQSDFNYIFVRAYQKFRNSCVREVARGWVHNGMLTFDANAERYKGLPETAIASTLQPSDSSSGAIAIQRREAYDTEGNATVQFTPKLKKHQSTSSTVVISATVASVLFKNLVAPAADMKSYVDAKRADRKCSLPSTSRARDGSSLHYLQDLDKHERETKEKACRTDFALQHREATAIRTALKNQEDTAEHDEASLYVNFKKQLKLGLKTQHSTYLLFKTDLRSDLEMQPNDDDADKSAANIPMTGTIRIAWMQAKQMQEAQKTRQAQQDKGKDKGKGKGRAK